MWFRLLGPVEVESDDGTIHTLARRQERDVLAILLLNAGTVTPVDRLVTLLWDGDPPAEPRRILHSHISRIRRLLAGAGAADHDIGLTAHRSGYVLVVDPELVDAHRFRRLLSAAGQCTELAERDRLLREALALWRGPALNRPTTDPLRHRLCADLDELHLQAQERSLATGIELGRHHELIPELARLEAEHSTRQRLSELRMLALYRDGRTADALDVYQCTRDRLADTLGLDPDPTLQQLHTAILRGDPLDAVDTVRTTTVTAPVPPAQLPADLACFAGRTRHLEQLDALLPDPGIAPTATAVVITAIGGTAGIGKTALAVHWAHRVADRFPDGQLYVNLRGFDPSGQTVDAATAIRGFLDALNVPPQRIPADPDAQAALYRSSLTGRRVLIVIDNARDSAQTRHLLPGAPGCLALVTSRNQLTSLVAATGAHAITLDLLTPDEALDLLTRRIGWERIAAERAAVDDIIARCAGLPLALSLVAAQAAIRPDVGLRVLADQLHDSRHRWQTLAGDDPATDIRAVFSWSYRAITPAAARLFRLLGLHAGADLTAPAAASLAASDVAEVRPVLAELVHANLIAEHNDRYFPHDLLHAYATDLANSLDPDDQRRAASHRLLDHYLHTAHSAERLLNPTREPLSLAPPAPGVTPEQPADRQQALAWFTAEHAVVVAAVGHAAATGFDTHTWQLAWALRSFLDLRGHWHDLAAVGRLAVTAAQRSADRTAQARAHRTVARADIMLGRLDDAHTHLSHALDLSTQTGDRVGEAKTHNYLAHLWERQHHPARALNHARQALDLHRAAGHEAGQAYALNTVGWCQALLGHHRAALTSCQQALPLFQNLDNRDGQAYAWDGLGYAHHHLGSHSQALTCYQHALTLLRDLGDRYGEATTLARLGDTHHAIGDSMAAHAAWQEALTILEELDHPDSDTVQAKLRDVNSGQQFAGS